MIVDDGELIGGVVKDFLLLLKRLNAVTSSVMYPVMVECSK